MRNIEIYRYDELTDEAKKVARSSVYDRVYDNYGTCDWDDANETLSRFYELADVDVEIGESSQGPYIKRSIVGDHVKSLSGDEVVKFFEDLKKTITDCSWPQLWCDYELGIIAHETSINGDSYVEAISRIVLKFYSKIESQCYNYWHNDELAEEYILEHDLELEFFENGKIYENN